MAWLLFLDRGEYPDGVHVGDFFLEDTVRQAKIMFGVHISLVRLYATNAPTYEVGRGGRTGTIERSEARRKDAQHTAGTGCVSQGVHTSGGRNVCMFGHLTQQHVRWCAPSARGYSVPSSLQHVAASSGVPQVHQDM